MNQIRLIYFPFTMCFVEKLLFQFFYIPVLYSFSFTHINHQLIIFSCQINWNILTMIFKASSVSGYSYIWCVFFRLFHLSRKTWIVSIRGRNREHSIMKLSKEWLDMYICFYIWITVNCVRVLSKLCCRTHSWWDLA